MNDKQINLANDKIRSNTEGFTNSQKKAYGELLDFINSPYNPKDYKRALVGSAGTGKTFLLKSLIQNCNLGYSGIRLASPTHKACRVLKGSININNIIVNTLQSDLGLMPNFNLENFDINNPPFDSRSKIKIGNGVSLYIIDEASMINFDLLKHIEDLCKKINCKIIFVGDASQLCPVKDTCSYAFKNIKVHKLVEIVRQGEDNPISDLLILLRNDIKYKTINFLNFISNKTKKFNDNLTKGYAVCNTSEFEELVKINFSDEQLTTNVDYAKVIAYTNVCVSSWNKFIRNTIIADANKCVLTKNDLILSYTTLVDSFNDAIIRNSEEYIINDIVNCVHSRYNIKGFIVKFTSIYGGKTTLPLFIVDHKDYPSLLTYIKLSKSLINAAKTANAASRAKKWKDYYDFKESCLLLTNIVNGNNTVEYNRDLDYGFAITSHKSQGSTYDTVFVDVNDMVFDKFGNPYNNIEEINRRLYVALSRARNKVYLRYGN